MIALLLAAIVWTPTAGQYTLAAQPTSANTEQVCFIHLDAQGNEIAELGCVVADAACLADLPNCRLELVVTVPLDGERLAEEDAA